MNLRLKELREQRGFSQEALSKISGVSLTTIVRLEDQTNVDVNTDTLVILADALHVSLDVLANVV